MCPHIHQNHQPDTNTTTTTTINNITHHRPSGNKPNASCAYNRDDDDTMTMTSRPTIANEKPGQLHGAVLLIWPR